MADTHRTPPLGSLRVFVAAAQTGSVTAAAAQLHLTHGAVQLLWKCPLSDERYVSERAWESAILDSCPLHPEGGCGLERLGTYARVAPAGARVPRWWCPKAGVSISLLPSFLSARLSGTLAEVEAFVAAQGGW